MKEFVWVNLFDDLESDKASEDKKRMDKIRIYPDPILMKKAETIENIGGKIKNITDRMAEFINMG